MDYFHLIPAQVLLRKTWFAWRQTQDKSSEPNCQPPINNCRCVGVSQITGYPSWPFLAAAQVEKKSSKNRPTSSENSTRSARQPAKGVLLHDSNTTVLAKVVLSCGTRRSTMEKKACKLRKGVSKISIYDRGSGSVDHQRRFGCKECGFCQKQVAFFAHQVQDNAKE